MAVPAKSILVFLTLVSLGGSVEWNGFVGKYGPCTDCSEAFYQLPVTRDQAIGMSPSYVDAGKDPDFDVSIYCLKNDPHVCPLFDKKGHVAGLRISHLKNEVATDLSKFPYKYDEVSVFNSTNFLGQDLWYNTFLFSHPDNLKKNGNGRRSTEETAEGLWVRLPTGWTEIPRDECQTQKAGWQKQGFFPWMGNHYTYGITEDCSMFMPLLPLFHKGRLMGLSFPAMGRYKNVDRDWFDNIPANGASKIILRGFECLKKWSATYGISNFHFYFNENPRLVLVDQSPSC